MKTIRQGYHVFNMQLASHDVLETEEEAEGIVEHFLEDGYVLEDIAIVLGKDCYVEARLVTL